MNAYGTKLDFGVKYLKVKPDHIFIHYDGPVLPMLHTKLHYNPPTDSGEKDFLKVFPIYRHGNHLGHVTKPICTDFHFCDPKIFHMVFGFK